MLATGRRHDNVVLQLPVADNRPGQVTKPAKSAGLINAPWAIKCGLVPLSSQGMIYLESPDAALKPLLFILYHLVTGHDFARK